MNENDFLYARQETMPEDFGKDLWQQLQEQDKKQLSKPAIWTIAAASLLTAIIGLSLVLSRVPAIATLMNVPVNSPTFTQHGIITTNNIDQLQPFARLGNGMITGMHMMPDGEQLLIAATTGLYLHDAQDLSAEPEQIYEGPIGYYSDIDANGNLYGLAETVYSQQNDAIIITRWNGVTGERHDILHLDSLTLGALEGLEVKPDGTQILLSLCPEFRHFSNYGIRCSQQAYVWYDTITGEKLFEISFTLGNIVSNYAISDDWSTFVYWMDTDESETLNQPVIKMLDLATYEIRTVVSLNDSQVNQSPYVWYFSTPIFSHDGNKLILRGSFIDYQSVDYDVYDVAQLWETTEPINPYINNDDVLYLIIPSGNVHTTPILSPDSQYMFFISDTRLFRYNLLETEIPISPLISDLNQGYSYIPSDTERAVFSPDGATLYIRSAGNIVMAYDTETLNKIDEMAYYTNDAATEFQFTDDGSKVVLQAGSHNNGIPDIWTIDTDSPNNTSFLPDGITASTNHFAISPNGTAIAYQLSGSWNVPNHLWIHNSENDQTVQLAARPKLLDLRFWNDDTVVAIAANSVLNRWSVENLGSDNPSPQREEIALTGGVSEHVLAFTNAHHVITDDNVQWVSVTACDSIPTCEHNLFKIWDIESGEIIAVIESDNFRGFGSMAFSPDSELFAYGYCAEFPTVASAYMSCTAGEVRFYTLDSFHDGDNFTDTPTALLTLTGFETLPASIAFHPVQQADGSWLVAITEWNTRTQLWQVHEDGTAEVLLILDTVRQPVAFDPTGGLMFTTADTLQAEVWGVPLVETAANQ